MNAEEVAGTADALRRSLLLVHSGQMSEAAGSRIEGALGALSSIIGDPTLPLARSRIEDSIRRLTAIREEGGMTLATAHRTEGALIALQSIDGDGASLLARLGPCQQRLPAAPGRQSNPADPQTEVRLTHLGQRPTLQVQL